MRDKIVHTHDKDSEANPTEKKVGLLKYKKQL